MEKVVPKLTGTYADPLCAIGYATLLLEMTGASPRIQDRGADFLVTVDDGRAIENWQPPTPGFMYIWRRSKEPQPKKGTVLDYEQEQVIKEAVKKSTATRAAKTKVRQAVEEVTDTPTQRNSPEYHFATLIESMRKGWMSDKTLHEWIYDNPSVALETVKTQFEGMPKDLGCKWSNSQILNPSTGKGVHSAKTVAKSASGFSLGTAFDDWMKLRALNKAMLAYRSGDDFKFYVIAPGDIAPHHIERIRNEIRDAGLWGVIKLDISAVLLLLRSLLMYSDYREGEIKLSGRRPNQIIRGLRLSFFKSLGTAAALMNDSFLPLPSWFDIESRSDVSDYLEIVTEPYGEDLKRGPLAAMREDHSDDLELLQKYRRWLTSGTLDDLLGFHGSFASWLLRKTAANEYAPSFQSRILHTLLSKGYPEVKEIIDSSGFQNIARAIRNTTIYAAGMSNSNREIRFGLAQNLKQRIRGGKEEFLAALSDFVQQQNWEIVHRLKGVGFQVAARDLDDIVMLTDEHGAELVGMLLLAYGFSRADATAKDSVEATTA